jgi:hypothetical protein
MQTRAPSTDGFARAARRILIVLAIGCAGTTACARTVEHPMGQAITMGPFTFTVVSAAQGKQWESAEGTFREIDVRIRVERDNTAPFTDTFSSLFLGRLDIVDAAGNRIGGDPRPLAPVYSNGRYRSNQYSCLFRYSRSLEGVRDFAAIGTKPTDFRLIITHPAPVGTEPRRVAVQLE